MKTAVLILVALVALLIVCSLEVFVAVVMRYQEQSDKLDEYETRLNNLSEAGRITTARIRELEQSNQPNQ
jgi:NADH:ubiquinone oxidoreductase subunit 3 (subunit A)